MYSNREKKGRTVIHTAGSKIRCELLFQQQWDGEDSRGEKLICFFADKRDRREPGGARRKRWVDGGKGRCGWGGEKEEAKRWSKAETAAAEKKRSAETRSECKRED